MRVLEPLQDRATTGAGKRLVLPQPRRVRFLIRGEGSVSAGAVTIECCPESTKAGKFWLELATIPVPADNGLAQYYTEEASGLFRARISRPVSNGSVTVTPLVSRSGPDRTDRTRVVWRQQWNIFVVAMPVRCHQQHNRLHSRSHDAVIRVCDSAGNVIETHEHDGDFRERNEISFAA